MHRTLYAPPLHYEKCPRCGYVPESFIDYCKRLHRERDAKEKKAADSHKKAVATRSPPNAPNLTRRQDRESWNKP